MIARAMDRWCNSGAHYGRAAIVLHWAMALLLAVLTGMGLVMVRMPDAGWDVTKIWLILLHKALGVLALALVAVRLAWRVAQRLPALARGLPEWQQVAARLAHLLLYALMFALPLTGWVMSSAAGFPVSVFGLATLPDLVGPSEPLYRQLAAVHRWLADALLALAALHAAAALRHHFVLRDDTLQKILRTQ